ncbi:MAG: hypothetical protein F6K00_05430 [Leptolyngbya sp. SIOISBB]|nr:hypothetical protein [Leptolyngbya sp. SIOISBB]
MNISDREAQIVRIQSTSFQPELPSALAATLRQAVLAVTKVTLEAALVEERASQRARQPVSLGRRSGSFTRVLDTEQGRIDALRVPKLRSGNKDTTWQFTSRGKFTSSKVLAQIGLLPGK